MTDITIISLYKLRKVQVKFLNHTNEHYFSLRQKELLYMSFITTNNIRIFFIIYIFACAEGVTYLDFRILYC